MAATVSTLLLIICKWMDTGLWHLHTPTGHMQIGALIWLGAIGSGVCLYLYCMLIQRIGAVMATMITYLMTITGVVMGVVFLQETFSRIAILGCLCISR